MRRILLVCLGVLALGGCGGGGPALTRSTAEPLARQADAVAARLSAGDACGARDHARALQRGTIDAINAGRVPEELQEPLQNRANELVSELEPECLPSVEPESTAPPPEPPAARPRGKKKHGHGHEHDDHGPGHGHGHGHGHGPGPGHGHGKGPGG
jgi:hypothetical protein